MSRLWRRRHKWLSGQEHAEEETHGRGAREEPEECSPGLTTLIPQPMVRSLEPMPACYPPTRMPHLAAERACHNAPRLEHAALWKAESVVIPQASSGPGVVLDAMACDHDQDAALGGRVGDGKEHLDVPQLEEEVAGASAVGRLYDVVLHHIPVLGADTRIARAQLLALLR